MDKVLITGGTGFVGTWMRQTKPEGLLCTYLDSVNYNSKWEGLLSNGWDYIVHLAPIAPARVLENAKQKASRFLYASSGIVDHPENDTEYRQNKIKWERECLDSGVDVVIARLYAFSGDRPGASKAWLAFNEAARTNQPIVITGDGTTTRSYMEGWELGFWMWTLLLHGDSGEVYDVGSEKPVTMLELAWKLVQQYNSTSRIEILGGKDPMPYYVPKDMMKTKGLAKRWIKNVVY